MRSTRLVLALFAATTCAGCVLPTAFEDPVQRAPDADVAGDALTTPDFDADDADAKSDAADDIDRRDGEARDTTRSDTATTRDTTDRDAADAENPAEALWWDARWPNRMRVTVLPFADSAEPLTNLAVAVRVRIRTDDTTSHAAMVDTLDEAGLRVVDAAHTNQLAWEKEHLSATDFDLWVNVPEVIPAEGTHFWLYWNGPPTQAPAPSGPVWDDDFVGVWHMTPEGAFVPNAVAGGPDLTRPSQCWDRNGVLGRGVECLSGEGMDATVTDLPTGDFTLEAVVRPKTLTVPDVVLQTDAYALSLQSNRTVGAMIAVGTPTTLITSIALADGYDFAAFLRADAYVRLQAGAVTGPSIEVGAAAVTPGTDLRVAFDLQAEVDEVRISRIARPPAYLAFQALQVEDDALRYGPAVDGATPVAPIQSARTFWPIIAHPDDGHVVMVPIVTAEDCPTMEVSGLGLTNWALAECITATSASFSLQVWVAWGRVQQGPSGYAVDVANPSGATAFGRVVPLAGANLRDAPGPVAQSFAGKPSLTTLGNDVIHELPFSRAFPSSPIVYFFLATPESSWEQTSRTDALDDPAETLVDVFLLTTYGLASQGTSSTLLTGTSVPETTMATESVGVGVELRF